MTDQAGTVDATAPDTTASPAPREWPSNEKIKRWTFEIGAAVLVAVAILTVVGRFDDVGKQLNVPQDLWDPMRQAIAGIVVIAVLGWILTVWHGEAYMAALWFTVPRLPGLIAVGWLLVYLAPPRQDLPPAAPLAIGLWTVLVVWLLLLVPLRRIAEIPTAAPETYREIVTRYYQLRARIDAGRATRTGPFAEATKQLEVVRRMMDLKDDPPGPVPRRAVAGGTEWATATGYINAWEALNRADEALIDASPIESALAEGLHDMLRLGGSSITNAGHLQDALRAAVRQYDAEVDRLYFYPQRRRRDDGEPDAGPAPAPNGAGARAAAATKATASTPGGLDERARDVLAKEVIREVRHAVNNYRTSHASALIRARSRLLRSIFVTGIAADVLLALAILMQVDRSTLATAAVFFLVGGVVGLFNRLRLEGEGGPAMTSDFGLYDARLLGTLLISGLAGVGGVLLISAAPLANVINGPAPSDLLPLDQVFSLETNRIGLLVAALFGLTPELVVGALRKQTDTIKKELSSTEAAASGPLIESVAR